MQDNRVNIDILFRNGLKELEVLPPAGVWNDIAGVVDGRRRRSSYLTAAAAVAALAVMASSFWLMTSLVTLDIMPGTLTLNQDVMPGSSLRPMRVASTSVIPVTYNEANDVIVTETRNIILPPEGDFKKPEINIVSFDAIFAEIPVTSETVFLPDDDLMNFFLPVSGRNTVIFSSSASQSALSISDPVREERWSLGAVFSPTYFVPGKSDNQEMSNMLRSEKMFISYSGGISLSYSINSRFSLSTGFYYSSIGQKVSDVSTYTGFAPYVASKGPGDISLNTSAGKIVSTNQDVFFLDNSGSRVSSSFSRDVFDPEKAGLPFAGDNLIQNFGYVELPLMVRYKVVDRKMDFNLLGGFSYSILVGNSVYTTSFSGEKILTGHTEGLSPLNVSSTVGFGMEYSLSGSVFFNIEPMMRYSFNSLSDHNTSVIHPLSFGIFSGFYYKF